MTLELQPVTISEAVTFIRLHHRHHWAEFFGLFAIGVNDGGKVIGVALVAKPVARLADNGWTAEVSRLCVLDGYKNACSMLYAACWRAARAMGYKKLITYILADEPGTSLYAAGWKCLGTTGGGSWSRKSRPRIDKHPTQAKLKFEMCG